MAYRAGLLSPTKRKNSWQLAELSGDPHPYGFPHLLGRADWDPAALQDRLRTYVTAYLPAPVAVGVSDETGFLKKGQHSAGVARHYSGTAGRIENSLVGVFLAYASRHGHTLLDRELYLPAAWTTDPDRCRRAGIPTPRTFATKPALARPMLQRTFDAGVVLAWVTGDCTSGMIGACGCVWRVATKHTCWPSRGRKRSGRSSIKHRSSSCWRTYRRKVGRGFVREPAVKDHAGTIGGGST